MSRIVVFGAGGRAGRRVVAQAVARGHEVTAVVRDPAKHAGIAESAGGPGVTIVAGDVTIADDVAAISAGHDAAVSAVYDADAEPGVFFAAAARALVDGLGRSGVGRLVAVGIGTALEVAPGVAVHDTPGFPSEYRAFSVGHAAELDVFRGSPAGLDWVVVTPPPVVLDADAEPTGRYRVSAGNQALAVDTDLNVVATFSYADLATALLDEAVELHHHRTVIAIG